MSRYSMNEEELRKGQQLLLHVGNKLSAMIQNVENARASLEGYNGYGIERQSYTLETQKNVLTLQIENVERLRNGIQQVIDRTIAANQEAKAELLNSELNTGFQTAADIFAAEQAKREAEERKRREEEERKKAQQQAQENRRPGNGGGSSGSAGTNYPRVMYYNKCYENDPRGTDTGSSCYVSSYAMILCALGIATTPGEIWLVNGGTNNVNHYAIAQRYNVSGNAVDITYASNKQQMIYEALKQNPQGIMMGNANHKVYAYLDGNGNIKINDPGQINVDIGWEGGEGISIDRTWMIGSWDNVTFYRTVNRNT